VRVIDYKSSRAVPERAADVPDYHLRQMAAYAAALEKAYPGRTIEAAVLYTAVPRLIAIPGELLAEHKRALLVAQ